MWCQVSNSSQKNKYPIHCAMDLAPQVLGKLLINFLYSITKSSQSTYFIYFFWGATPRNVQGLFIDLFSEITLLRCWSTMGYQELNLVWSHANKVLYSLFYHSSPFLFIFKHHQRYLCLQDFNKSVILLVTNDICIIKSNQYFVINLPAPKQYLKYHYCFLVLRSP